LLGCNGIEILVYIMTYIIFICIYICIFIYTFIYSYIHSTIFILIFLEVTRNHVLFLFLMNLLVFYQVFPRSKI
jgi:hypothetical protein